MLKHHVNAVWEKVLHNVLSYSPQIINAVAWNADIEFLSILERLYLGH